MASAHVSYPKAFDRLATQPRVRAYLGTAAAEGKIGHAYLFVGAPGSGQNEAALALAQSLVCEQGGCAECEECTRVMRRSHPDIHWIAPEGAAGYVVEQVRSLIEDVSLAPIRATSKVYIMDRVETLRDSSANALLKTIEEPPAGVVFILMARTTDAVLPTIVSRCQLVPFRVADPEEAAHYVARTAGLAENDPAARVALAVAGTPELAVDYIASTARREARRLMVNTLGELSQKDAWGVLVSARELAAAAKVPLDELSEQQQEDADQAADFLSSKAQKLVEQRNKRELTARERSGIMELLSAAESLLRDVLVRLEDVAEPVVNADCEDVVARICASTSSKGALLALAAVSRAREDLARNVSPQLALEVMLCSCKEALCPPSFR